MRSGQGLGTPRTIFLSRVSSMVEPRLEAPVMFGSIPTRGTKGFEAL